MTADPYRRARRWFWICTGLAVVAVGALSQALRAPDGPLAALATAVSGMVAVTFLVQAARIQRALEPGPHRQTTAACSGGGQHQG